MQARRAVRHHWILAYGALATAVAGCSGPPAPDAVIEISNVQFSPMDASVPVGGTVEWRFDDGGVLHHVESPGAFDSGITGAGTYTHTFDHAGTFVYTCSIHPYMTGTVTVR